MIDVTAEERDFYADRLILLEGAILEFLSCMEMIRRYQVSLGRGDPISSWQARVKRASSMREKLRRRGLPETAETALSEVRDAAGVRLVCPFVEDIRRTADPVDRDIIMYGYLDKFDDMLKSGGLVEAVEKVAELL